MAIFPLSSTFLVILWTFFALLPVLITAKERPQMDRFNPSPQIGDSVEFQCSGHILDQQEDEFFENGGRLVWLADGEIIANSTLKHQEQFVADHDKYSVTLHNLSTSNIIEYMFQLNINYISVDDSKKYHCALLSAENETVAESRPKSVRVHYAPDSVYPQCTIDSNPLTPNMVTLKCRSQTAFPNVYLFIYLLTSLKRVALSVIQHCFP